MQCKSSEDGWNLGNKRCVIGKRRYAAEPYTLALCGISRKVLTQALSVFKLEEKWEQEEERQENRSIPAVWAVCVQHRGPEQCCAAVPCTRTHCWVS